MTELKENIRRVTERIRDAAEKARRDPASITVVAVGKTFHADALVEAYELGLRHFGENRVEEARIKIPEVNARVATPPTWHMVGHVQRRKVNDVARQFQWVHSIDSVELARRFEKQLEGSEQRISALVEINVSGEKTKYGFTPDPLGQLLEAIAEIVEMRHVDVQGLMTVAPIVADSSEARPYFRALRELRESLQAQFPGRSWNHLSMGMTDDFEAAIAEGATMVRIGRAIFGARSDRHSNPEGNKQ